MVADPTEPGIFREKKKSASKTKLVEGKKNEDLRPKCHALFSFLKKKRVSDFSHFANES